MIIGYARVSTQDQNPALQTDALVAAGSDLASQLALWLDSLEKDKTMARCLGATPATAVIRK